MTLQWDSPVLMSIYLLKYYRSGNAEKSLRLEISRDSNKCVTYTVRNLSPNTKYQFQLAMVNELGMEGEFTDIFETCTGKQNVVICTFHDVRMYVRTHICT